MLVRLTHEIKRTALTVTVRSQRAIRLTTPTSTKQTGTKPTNLNLLNILWNLFAPDDYLIFYPLSFIYPWKILDHYRLSASIVGSSVDQTQQLLMFFKHIFKKIVALLRLMAEGAVTHWIGTTCACMSRKELFLLVKELLVSRLTVKRNESLAFRALKIWGGRLSMYAGFESWGWLFNFLFLLKEGVFESLLPDSAHLSHKAITKRAH